MFAIQIPTVCNCQQETLSSYLVCETLEFICIKVVVIPQNVIVTGTTGALKSKYFKSNNSLDCFTDGDVASQTQCCFSKLIFKLCVK